MPNMAASRTLRIEEYADAMRGWLTKCGRHIVLSFILGGWQAVRATGQPPIQRRQIVPPTPGRYVPLEQLKSNA